MGKYQLHYSHPDGRIVGDVMPYYYQGTFHVFYLLNGSGHNDINHEHAISTDLIHWENVPPSIRHEDNCAFTGCYLTTPDGIHHCFFTRWNPENKNGRESIGHATSNDLISWVKTDLHLIPDGKIYSAAQYRDFRDPCVFYDNQNRLFHMFVLADGVGHENTSTSWDENWIQGHYISSDLISWSPLPPLLGSFADECPDYFFENGVHYIHGCHHYAIAPHFEGPYQSNNDFVLDLGLRAAKMCFVEKRRLWFGGFIGGSFTLPRELIIQPNQKLGLKLAKEIYDVTNHLVNSSKANFHYVNLETEKAHRFRVDVSQGKDLELSIIFIGENIKSEFLFDRDQLVLLHNQEKKFLCKLDNSECLSIDIVVDSDIIECYWNGVGTHTMNTKNAVRIIEIQSKNQKASVAHFTL